MKRNTRGCTKCGRKIALPNYKRHFDACDGVDRSTPEYKDYEQVGDKFKCPECGKLFTKNGIGSHIWHVHTKKGREFHKHHNPGIGYETGEREAWNKGLTKEDHPSLAKLSKSLKKHYENNPGTFTGLNHTQEAKDKISKAQRELEYRRLKRNTIKYEKKSGETIILDSTWELELARQLDKLGISWKRPEPIKWKDGDGKVHNYYPDFYLTNYDLYLDPKNSYAFEVQEEKIDILNKLYDNIIWIKSKGDCENFNLNDYI